MAGADLYTTFGPETVDSYEVGARTSFRGPVPGSFNIATFYNNFANQQIFVAFQGPAVVPNNSEVNAGKSRIWGVEIEATASPIHRRMLDIAYSYLSSKLESLAPIPRLPASGYTVASPSSVAGYPLPFTPKHKASVSADYTLPLGVRIGKVSAGATYVYTDQQLVVIGGPYDWLPAYGLLNLHLDWNSIGGKPVDASFFMTNTTNKFYSTRVTDSYQTVGDVSRSLGEPRVFGFRLRARFGS